MEEYVKVFRLEVLRPAMYEKFHLNSFSEHGVNISKEEVALYFSSKVSFLAPSGALIAIPTYY